MAINKKTTCQSCNAEFEIEPLEDYPILYCPACGEELEQDDDEAADDQE